MNYFGYIEEETDTYSISKNILSSLNPYFLQSPYKVSINITDVRKVDDKKYFIIKFCGNKLRSLDAMTILSIIHEICEGTVSISQIIQQLNQKISSKDHKNLILSKFFYFGSSYTLLTNVWKNRYQTTDNDIDFHSYTPLINQWLAETFVPFCLEY
ncbi:hypothetical protein TVAG_293900 [Trichomonas vaginalis G3]|uniref:Uncharacterized protein n=1 Tax=Trichomonas vaginalis (strain ATCC PRA-98 / G3) TaxID=412133 RepID=A2FKC0_TRIV3|nr:hypothetical protein TVAGG3_0619680 [Trichomonas vaginalis G3]EAX94660.1 hypothetical protein TVAG_293900 [Trichomonas vaginalis G3]KAI5503804.1 hypothetical protein TVAGG3_0619680 [Trichomonas vaginalis G3]|eukprot:XP_001307590.1 hypothetical protein [Trichomonas vaginalis G3]